MGNTNHYLNIKIAGDDSQVGVINLGALPISRTANLLEVIVEDKLIDACQSHLAYAVRVKSLTFKHLDAPISGSAVITVDTDGGTTEEIIELEQTWVY